MRTVIAHILLFTITVHLFYSSGFLLDYYVNSDSYKARCENINSPELNCDGKCILALKMKSSTESNQEMAPVPLNLEFQLTELDVNIRNKPLINPEGLHAEVFYSHMVQNDCFHPPRLV